MAPKIIPPEFFCVSNFFCSGGLSQSFFPLFISSASFPLPHFPITQSPHSPPMNAFSSGLERSNGKKHVLQMGGGFNADRGCMSRSLVVYATSTGILITRRHTSPKRLSQFEAHFHGCGGKSHKHRSNIISWGRNNRAFFDKPCLSPAKERGGFDENGEKDEFRNLLSTPIERGLCSSDPLRTTQLGVTRAQAWFTKSAVFCSLNLFYDTKFHKHPQKKLAGLLRNRTGTGNRNRRNRLSRNRKRNRNRRNRFPGTETGTVLSC